MKVGFIGMGSMAQAMIEGFLKSGALEGRDIYASGGNYERLEKNCRRFGCIPCRTNEDVIEHSDMVVISLKAAMVADVIRPLAKSMKGRIVVSIAAGYTFDTFRDILGPDVHYICTIPNTPVSVGEGITVCEDRHSLEEEEYEAFYTLFSAIGLVQPVETELVGTAGTVAGCGPAFASMFLEALGDAGVKYGLPRRTAYELAAQMLCGTGKLYTEKKQHPGEMKDAVCSPGGTTIRGVSALERAGFRDAVIRAVDEIEG